jgi:methyl-accepting chemotaxis protein
LLFCQSVERGNNNTLYITIVTSLFTFGYLWYPGGISVKGGMRFLHSITTKLILGFLLLFLVIGGVSFTYFYRTAQDALFATMQTDLKDVAVTTASQVSGDVVEGLKPGDESTTQFTTIRDQLRKMRQDNPDVRYSYIMKVDGSQIKFVVDDTYGIEANAASIGDVYVDTENGSRQQQDFQEMKAGLDGPSVASSLYSDQWGDFLSAYAPVKDSHGKAVAFLGVDMDAKEVQARQDFVTHQLYIALGLILLAATLLVAYFAISMSRDIRQLNQALRAMYERRQHTITSSDVKRKDELGDLSKTIKDMETNIWSKLGDGKNNFLN